MDEYDHELSKIVAELNRAAPSQKYAASRLPQSTPSLDQLLHAAAGRNASDVLLIAGAPIMLRIAGNLAPRALGLVMEWAAKHQEELLADWKLAMEGNLPVAIEPLR